MRLEREHALEGRVIGTRAAASTLSAEGQGVNEMSTAADSGVSTDTRRRGIHEPLDDQQPRRLPSRLVLRRAREQKAGRRGCGQEVARPACHNFFACLFFFGRLSRTGTRWLPFQRAEEDG